MPEVSSLACFKTAPYLAAEGDRAVGSPVHTGRLFDRGADFEQVARRIRESCAQAIASCGSRTE